MRCFKHFCCGYSLRSGGIFIGYFSILVYTLLIVLCLIFLWSFQTRIDSNEEIDVINIFRDFSRFLRVKPKNYETESSLQELKSEIYLRRYLKPFLMFYLKAYSVIFIAYILLLLIGILSSSFLITGAKLVKKKDSLKDYSKICRRHLYVGKAKLFLVVDDISRIFCTRHGWNIHCVHSNKRRNRWIVFVSEELLAQIPNNNFYRSFLVI